MHFVGYKKKIIQTMNQQIRDKILQMPSPPKKKKQTKNKIT